MVSIFALPIERKGIDLKYVGRVRGLLAEGLGGVVGSGLDLLIAEFFRKIIF